MLKKVFIVLLVLFVGFLVFVSLRPAEFEVTRSAVVEAPVEEVFPHVNNLKNWEAWSPWAKLDPEAVNTYEGPEEGEGAAFGWSGNSDIGEGKITITESKPNELIQFQLEFIRPFKSTCTTRFAFEPQDDQTSVTWTMQGHNNFMGKLIGLFMDYDAMIGRDFEAGFANLKKVSESDAAPPAAEATTEAGDAD